MTDIRIDEFVSECNGLGGVISLDYEPVAPSIRFSNSGRRGLKYFSISLADLVQSFKDIKNRIDDYIQAQEYSQETHRTLFYALTSETASALGGTQTMPFFNVLSKIIHVANNLDVPFQENRIIISEETVDKTLDYLTSQLPDNELYLSSLGSADLESSEKSGTNVIFYGAPGVGKSYKIDKECNSTNSIRTIFHPDTQNSDFIGCLKPKMNGSNVVYEFRAGPFTKAIVKAYANQDKHIYLVIEEINRAASAAVFGEVFQLLDRDSSGKSVYPIDLVDPDMLEFIESKAPTAITNGQLRIPSNLSLFATMNSSDQAVMPMDTAFKRRWIFEYIPIDFSSCPTGYLYIPIRDNAEVKVSWSDFAKSINNALIDNSIPEDRLLGPWFLSPAELKTPELTQQTLKGKVCLYLWDDVLRHGLSTVIFDVGIKNYGQLNSSFKPNNPIFNERIEQELLNVAITQAEAIEE